MRLGMRRIAAWLVDWLCILIWVAITAAVGVPLYLNGITSPAGMLTATSSVRSSWWFRSCSLRRSSSPDVSQRLPASGSWACGSAAGPVSRDFTSR
ncbi:MAG: hypothetical protein ACTH2U_01360 [Brevibacterium sp.]